VKATKPTVELGAEGVVKALTGAEGGLEGLLGLPPGSMGGKTGQAGGSSSASPANPVSSLLSSPAGAAAMAAIQGQLTALGEEIKKGVRELKLTVSWKEGASQEKFTVVTYAVVLTPGSQAAATPLVAPTQKPPGVP
jgi:general secretion pathway protein I